MPKYNKNIQLSRLGLAREEKSEASVESSASPSDMGLSGNIAA